jgi:hypothetical protein
MKRIVILFFLLIITLPRLQGQWYTKKYGVSDINFLNQVQLEESLKSSKENILISTAFIGGGGVIFLLFKYLGPGMSDDPTFIEELIGDEGMNKLGMAFGLGLAAGGVVGSVVYIGRTGKIRSVLRSNFPGTGSLQISPDIILNRYTRTSCPGIRLTYNF